MIKGVGNYVPYSTEPSEYCCSYYIFPDRSAPSSPKIHTLMSLFIGGGGGGGVCVCVWGGG